MASSSFHSVVPARRACVQVSDWAQPARPLPPPVGYPGQELDPLYALVPGYRREIAAHRLCLGVVEDATVIVRNGYDGVVLDSTGAAVRETTFYGRIFQEGHCDGEIEVEPAAAPLDEVFVAFDGSWWVYYHWLLFCLGAAGVANRLTPAACRILVPDFAACAPGRPRGVSAGVFGEVTRVVDPGRLLAVADGAYRVRRAHILFVEDGQVSDVALHPLFDEVFGSLKRPAAGRRRPQRLMISRGGYGGPARVTSDEEAGFDALATEYGFSRVRPERLSFQDQVDLFAAARVIVAPHGSALANLVFAEQTREVTVVELQTEIDGPGWLRPWFFVLAAAGGRAYAFLNRSAGDFTAERLRQVLAACGVARPWIGLRVARRASARAARWRQGRRAAAADR